MFFSLGLTGGLAAPLVAAGAGVIIGSAAAAGIATTAGAAILGSAFGVAGAGLAGFFSPVNWLSFFTFFRFVLFFYGLYVEINFFVSAKFSFGINPLFSFFF